MIKYKDGRGVWTPAQKTEAQTKAEARLILRDMERRCERQRRGLEPLDANPQRWALADLMRWWLRTYSATTSSHDKNTSSVNANIVNATIGEIDIGRLKAADIEEHIQGLAIDPGHAAGTLNHVIRFISRAFNKARKAGKFFGSNPALDVDKRKVHREVPPILTADEVRRFLAALDDQFRPLFAAAVYLGLRKGELLGLQKTRC